MSNFKFSLWLKKLGPNHYFEHGKSKTLCGKPMLGNNYINRRANEDECVECLKALKANGVEGVEA